MGPKEILIIPASLREMSKKLKDKTTVLVKVEEYDGEG